MTKSKKNPKKNVSSPVESKFIEIDEGVFGTRLFERGELPIKPQPVLHLLQTLKKLEAMVEEHEEEDYDDDYNNDDADSSDLLDLDELVDQQQFEAELKRILKTNDFEVNLENLQIFLKRIKTQIAPPCTFIGSDWFEWEVDYLTGKKKGGKQYEKLKQTQPSHTDKFNLIQVCNLIDEEEGIMVKVERTSDRRQFTLSLVDLEPIDDDDLSKFELINTYTLWFLNY